MFRILTEDMIVNQIMEKLFLYINIQSPCMACIPVKCYDTSAHNKYNHFSPKTMSELSPEMKRHLEQEMRRSEIASDLSLVTDKLGMPIDKDILQTVIAMRMSGFQTNASCEGHLDHGIKAPWIEVGSVPDSLASRALSNSPAEMSHPQTESVEEVRAREKIYSERNRLVNILDKFYHNRPCPAKSRLIVLFRLGQCRIISQGYGTQDALPLDTQSSMLDTYRAEMAEFTEWLNNNYEQLQ